MTTTYQYASVMRKTSEAGESDEGAIVAMCGKQDEVEIKREIFEGEVVGVRYELLELVELDAHMTRDQINAWVDENPEVLLKHGEEAAQ